MVKRFQRKMVLVCLLIGIWVNTGFCEMEKPAVDQFDSTKALIELLKTKGVISEKEAENFIRRHEQEVEKPKRVITIIPEETKEDYMKTITDQVTEKITKDLENVKEDINFMTDELQTKDRLQDRRFTVLEKIVTEDHASKLYKSEWARRIRFGGDIRLRYQSDFFDENNADLLDPANPDELMNTKVDRERYRYRVRLAANAVLADPREINVGKLEAGVRLSTGHQDDPISTNETIGDYKNKESFVLDRAYLQWTYKPELPIWDKIPQVTLTGGRMPNPWFFSDLLWDNDLNFEGVALNVKSDTIDNEKIKPFFTVGAFPIQEEEWSSRDKWLYAGQIGIEHKPFYNLSYKLGIAYYDYQNIEGIPNDPLKPGFYDFTAPQFQTKGNTLFDIDPTAGIKTALASDYNLLNITAQTDITTFFPIHVILSADYVKNLGFDKQQVAELTGNPDPPEETTGYQFGLLVGYPKTRYFGEWNTSLYYKHLEADAVLDAFTDSDFHLGGTNTKGWILGAEFGIYRNIWLTARWMTSNEIEGPPLAIDSLFLDINAEY